MTDNELLLQDRIEKIQTVIDKYGEENFYMSFSGGRDSTVMHYLFDMALPNNKIPRVYANTGIELNMIRDFVFNMQKTDDRIVIIKPTVPIKKMLEEEGYPVKNKIHAKCVHLYQTDRDKNMWKGYTGQRPESWHTRQCPKILMYQFTDENKLKISDMCCVRMKEEPLINWSKQNNKSIPIIGIMKEEGEQEQHVWRFRVKNLRHFNHSFP